MIPTPGTPPVRRSQFRRHGGIAVMFICAALAVSACGSPSTSSTQVQTTAKPTPTVKAAPTPTPVPANALESAMVDQMGVVRSMRVQFGGKDNGGTLSFDVVTDGNGNLSGTYVRQGKSAQIVIANGAIYMNGGDVINSFTGLGANPSATGWYQLPSSISGELLDTISSSTLLRACLSTITSASYSSQGTATIQGIKAQELAVSGADSWQFAVQASGTPNLVAMEMVSGGDNQPACNGGVIDKGPRSGATGVFAFSNFGAPVSITAPAGSVPLPNPDPAAKQVGG